MSDNQSATQDVEVKYDVDSVVEYNKLAKEYQTLLTKLESISKLIEQILKILLSYNPKVAEQVKEQLEKINEQNDDKSPEPRGDTS